MRILSLSAMLIAAGIVIAPWTALASPPSTDILIKAGGSSVYYYANDGRRYVFPNEKTYRSWFLDFSGVVTISDNELAAITLGGNVTYRPGIRMIKVQSDPKVYAVAPGGLLRWVTSETLAEDMYGQFWNQAIDDLSDAFFVNYRVGDPIQKSGDFSPTDAAAATDTIDANRGIAPNNAPRRADTDVAGVVDAWRKFALDDIDALRQQNGKTPLVMNALMNRIASVHSKDMAKFNSFAHEGSLGESPDERIRNGKIPDLSTHTFIIVPHPTGIGWTGENIGMATMPDQSDTVEKMILKLHRLFMDEPPDQPNHRTTMLSTLHPYSEVGIGPYVDDKGDLWLTEDYISR